MTQTCGHITVIFTCGAAPTRFYLTGHRCPAHTPAALRGRPEPGQTADPYPRPGSWMATQGASRLIDDRAIASGKRRSTPTQYRESRDRLQAS